jgi:tRNA pseudouridine32 synthase/23S rRNA pseudouridine746 synthase
MGIAKQTSCVSLPCIDKPYPSILSFLVQRFPQVEQSEWEQRIRAGKVLDEAANPIDFGTPYWPQKRLFYFREVAAEPTIPLFEKILFQNDEILVACKPPFLPVTPSGPYVNECLLNRVKATTGNLNLVPLHRIDRETSGLVIFSQNKETRGLYASLFSDARIKKTYSALAETLFCPNNQQWLVENRLVKGEPWFRMQVAVGAVNARSRIELVEFRDRRAKFLLYPITGKQHQLRLHMSGLGLSIMNDRYYPDLLPKQEDDPGHPLQLIAKRLEFTDPVSGQNMEFESERQLLD